MKNLIFATILFFIGQSVIWFQTNGQFVWDVIKRNPILVSFLGMPVAYMFIKASHFSHLYFGNIWAGRVMGFAMGIVSFAFLTWLFLGEPLTTKTLLTLLLAFGIILIQLFF